MCNGRYLFLAIQAEQRSLHQYSAPCQLLLCPFRRFLSSFLIDVTRHPTQYVLTVCKYYQTNAQKSNNTCTVLVSAHHRRLNLAEICNSRRQCFSPTLPRTQQMAKYRFLCKPAITCVSWLDNVKPEIALHPTLMQNLMI